MEEVVPQMEAEIKSPIIVLLGPFHGEGLNILTWLAESLRSNGIPVYTVPDLFPVPNPQTYTSEEACECSHKALCRADGAVWIFLEPEILGLTPGERDTIGGMAVEKGMAYELKRQRGKPYMAFLFSSHKYRASLSRLLQGGTSREDLEYVMERPDNLKELQQAVLVLCLSLLEKIRSTQ